MKIQIYFILMVIGFLSLLLSICYINKKLNILSLEKLIYSYIFSVIFFIFFSKLFYLFSELKFQSLKLIFISKDYFSLFKFIFSGYSFIGGYIGVIISCLVYSNLIKLNYKKLLKLYLISMFLIYSIMKIGCFVMGCCIGINNISIQLIESTIGIINYIYFMKFYKRSNDDKLLLKCFIYFFIIRFIISFFRNYSTIYNFIFVQLTCIILIIFGYVKFYKRSEKNEQY